MFKEKNNKGVTLIEMLLVIVLLSVLVIYGLQTLQDYNTQQNIKKSREQIQLLLNGARAYYNDHLQWPSSLQDLVNGRYVDASVICSPWPKPASIEGFPSGDNNAGQNYSCSNAQMYYEQIAPKPTCAAAGIKPTDPACFAYYGITIQLPNDKVADGLAAYLPTSIQCPLSGANIPSSQTQFTGLPNYVACAKTSTGYVSRVSSFTTRPTLLVQDLSGFVESIGTMSISNPSSGYFTNNMPPQQIPVPTCSPGTSPRYFAIPVNYKYSGQLAPPDAEHDWYPMNPNYFYPFGDWPWHPASYIEDFTLQQQGNPGSLTPQEGNSIRFGAHVTASSDFSNKKALRVHTLLGIDSTFIYFTTCLKDSQSMQTLCSPTWFDGTEYCPIWF